MSPWPVVLPITLALPDGSAGMEVVGIAGLRMMEA